MFDRDNAGHLLPKLRKFMNLPEFNEQNVKVKSGAIYKSYKWVSNFYTYVQLVEKIKLMGHEPKGYIPTPEKIKRDKNKIEKRQIKYDTELKSENSTEDLTSLNLNFSETGHLTQGQYVKVASFLHNFDSFHTNGRDPDKYDDIFSEFTEHVPITSPKSKMSHFDLNSEQISNFMSPRQ